MARMSTTRPTSPANQPPPLAGYNLYEQDAALVEAVRREGGEPWEAEIGAFGEALGGEPLEWGRLANEHPPLLRTHDRYGERIDEIEFHPAWDSLLRLGLDARVQSLPWLDERPRRACRTGGALHAARPGRGRRRLPALDDLRLGAGASHRTGAGGGVGPEADQRRRRSAGWR